MNPSRGKLCWSIVLRTFPPKGEKTKQENSAPLFFNEQKIKTRKGKLSQNECFIFFKLYKLCFFLIMLKVSFLFTLSEKMLSILMFFKFLENFVKKQMYAE